MTRKSSNNNAKESAKNNGQFVTGTSGNPAGRPRGSRNQSALLMEALLEGEVEELVRKAIDLAKAGDTGALRLCLERLMPPRKDRSVVFEMPPIESLDDISRGMKSIMAAISDGALSPQEGETISRILNEHASVMVNLDLQRRVEKLERGPSADDNAVEIIKRYQ